MIGLWVGSIGLAANAAAPSTSGELALAVPSYGRAISDLEYDVLRGHVLATRQVIGDVDRQLALWGTSTSLHFTIRKGDGSTVGPAVGTVGAGIGRAASDGTSVLIARTDASGNLWTRTITRDGSGLTPDRLQTTGTLEDLIFDGTNYLLIGRALGPTGGLFGLRLDRYGAPLSPASVALDGAAGFARARAAAGDGVVMVVMTDTGQPSSVWAMRLLLDGTALDTAPVRLSLPRVGHASGAPEVAFGSGRFLAVWADEAPVLVDVAYPYDTARRLEGAWLSAATPPTTGAAFAITDDAAGVGLGHVYGVEQAGAKFIVTTNRGYVVTLAPDATTPATATMLVPGQVSFRLDPAVATQRMRLASTATVMASGYDGTNYLVVLADDAGLGAVRLSTDGIVLDQPPLRLTTAGAGPTFAPSPVEVHAGGGQFLITWSTPGAWFGNRVTSTGQVLDGDGFEIAKSAYLRELNVVFLDGRFWVATCHGTIDGLLPLAGARDYQSQPGSSYCATICGPASCLVFEQQTHLWTPGRDVVVGELCDGCGAFPAAAVGAHGYAVLVRNGEIALDILDQNGGLVAVTAVLDQSNADAYAVAFPRIVFDGTDYVVLWQRQNEVAGQYQMLVARVAETGALLAAPQPVTPSPGVTYSAPMAVAGAPDQVLLAYSRTVYDPGTDETLQPRALLIASDRVASGLDGGAVDAASTAAPSDGGAAGIDAGAGMLEVGVTSDAPATLADAATSAAPGVGCGCTVGVGTSRAPAGLAVPLACLLVGLALRGRKGTF